MKPKLHYQPEIDGLRALAVLPVILFHAGIAAFGGGFVGVDVFFVISGYLISGIIAADLDRGRFTIGNFYQRRVRRILPALFVVMLASLAAGLILFLPAQLASLARSSLAALGFVSNIWLWGQAGYFMGDVHMFPLLHSWSLSLEEQYYIVFPPLLMLIARFRLPRLGIILAVLAGSLALALVGTYLRPSATFYLLPTRAWELMLGAAVALGAVREISNVKIREAIGWAGLAMIVIPVLAYSEATPFPGLAAVPPCLGTALLIVAGRDGGCRVTSALAARPLVGIGLISYSLYLWHWPLFVFARQVTLHAQLTPPAIALCIALAFLLAAGTWRWVEQPLRNGQRITLRPLLVWVIAGAVAIAALSLFAWNGLPGRMAPETLRLAAAKNSGSKLTEQCTARSATAAPCPLGAPGARPSFIVWGDSHAGAMGEAFDSIGRRQARAGLLYPFGGCPGLVDPTVEKILLVDIALCRERSRIVFERAIGDAAIRDVVLVDYWQTYRADPPAFARSIDRTVAGLRQAGKRVTIVAGVPAPGFDLPWALALRHQFGFALPRAADDFAPSAALLAIANRRGAALVDISPALCSMRPCPVLIDANPIFTDSNHLSREAVAKLVMPVLERDGVLHE